MRRSVIILGLFLFLCSQAHAAITVEQATDPEYMINGGFSEATAEDVLIAKNRANGKPVEPLYEKSNNPFVKFLKYVHAYIDPSIESDERYHHDIHLSPSFKDL